MIWSVALAAGLTVGALVTPPALAQWAGGTP